jgi:rhodanese-related sulfurtransferase
MSNTLIALIIVVAAVATFVVWKVVGGRDSAMYSTIEQLDPGQYQAEFLQQQTPHLLLDVRTPQEFNGGHIAGAVNIPLQSLPQRINELPQDRSIVLYCRSGNRSRTAANMLAGAGYSDVYDLGGIIKWQRSGLPVH